MQQVLPSVIIAYFPPLYTIILEKKSFLKTSRIPPLPPQFYYNCLASLLYAYVHRFFQIVDYYYYLSYFNLVQS